MPATEERFSDVSGSGAITDATTQEVRYYF